MLTYADVCGITAYAVDPAAAAAAAGAHQQYYGTAQQYQYQ